MALSRTLFCLSFIFYLAVSPVLGEVIPPTTDFTRAEAGEALPGGQATTRKTRNKNAFSHPSGNMPFSNQLDFRVGNGFFKKIWVSAPASTQASDGLGPNFNARSCQRCHLKDGRGHPPAGNYPDDTAVSMFLRLSVPPQNDRDRADLASGRKLVIPEPTYGGQLQDFAVANVPIEGRMHIEYREKPVTLSDGTVITLREPSYQVRDLQLGDLDPETMISPRVAPPMIGLGLLEAIPEEDLLAQEDPEDRDGDGISGKANRVWSLEQSRVMVGRFGWKAGHPTINQQNAAAFSGDIGLSSPLFPDGWGDCTARQKACRTAPDGNSPQYENVEAGSKVMDLLLFYTRNLAVPYRRDVDDPTILAGKREFYQAGCAACHQPAYRTASLPDQPEQSGQLIWPYTDLLLHDMGEGLADNRPEGMATGREWRTPPLWGLGLTETVNGHQYLLHDGRARGVLEAILWHGGEAQASRDYVVNLPQGQRDALLRFLNSL
ncbi:di-heme oxidoredictase family protein [Aestuariispira insulae]|uniref:CxxC motif-containing protein (DUF1111 family) n=1 Tax=Aestuariispira insulae TaxID=1461337 RepID=A0A3D9HJJ4_9PROT|nr:di-heme oxidoredictase family protein [Aestuariispira insulae]RED49633.1 CxxC motif-containing protein (DUF1111 family) [Aestuariispira insulae]